MTVLPSSGWRSPAGPSARPEVEGWEDLEPDEKAKRALDVIASQIARYPV